MQTQSTTRGDLRAMKCSFGKGLLQLFGTQFFFQMLILTLCKNFIQISGIPIIFSIPLALRIS